MGPMSTKQIEQLRVGLRASLHAEQLDLGTITRDDVERVVRCWPLIAVENYGLDADDFPCAGSFLLPYHANFE